jgi:RNA-binding protein NOB1
MALFQPPRRCKNLVLDAGPLLSLSPLRGLADKYYTVPQVLAELKDKRAQEHFERLGLQADAASLAHGAGTLPSLIGLSDLVFHLVIQFAKSTGDYAVLSHVDLSLIALTHALHEQAKAEEKRTSEASSSDRIRSSRQLVTDTETE